MQVAMVARRASPAAEADQLRRAMATFKHTGGVHKFQDKLITGMLDNGYSGSSPSAPSGSSKASAATAFRNRTPPASRLIAYASSWMKCHHPDVFWPRSSTRSPWASTRPLSSCATPASTASRCARSM